MFKIVLMATVYIGVIATGGECSKAMRGRETSIEKSKEFTTTSQDRLPAGYFQVNNITKMEEGCRTKFVCKKKLKNAETPKPCLKYCAKSIECDDGRRSVAASDQCVELNEAMVAQEYNDCRNEKSSSEIMPVAMIDFPCQPGYLPDSRGRCREVYS